MRVADYMIERLAEYSVDRVFLVTGRGMLYLSDAVAKHETVMGVSMHHEQSCAYAAQGYAMRRDGVGACLVSTGCGSTNAITGVLNAWQDGIPVVFVSGQHMTRETTYHTGLEIRTYGQQEANIVEMVRSITKYAVMIENVEDAAYEIDKALAIAVSDRKGPVWIDIPLDIQNARIEPSEVRHFNEEMFSDADPSDEDVSFVEVALSEAKRPVFLIGSGVRLSGAVECFRKIADDMRIPVVFDSAAVDVYPDENPLSMGAIGAMGGSRAGNFTVQNADLVIVIGCRLSSAQVGDNPSMFAREAEIIVVDIDVAETKKNTVRIDRFICADANRFLHRLNELRIDSEIDEWRDICLHWKELFPKQDAWCGNSDTIDLYHLAECIGRVTEKGQSILSDAGIEELVIPAVSGKKNDVRVIHPASQGCMGFALPAAIGVHQASGSSVIAVIGDGSVMMNLQELQTISYHETPLKLFVVNNNCYDVIRQRQKELFRARTIGTDESNGVSCPDFKAIAMAYNLPYICINNTKDLEGMVSDVICSDGPVLCEIIGGKDQLFLKNSYVVGERHRLIRRCLEDQEPFMDRDIFLKEMIVEPTDTFLGGVNR